MKPEFLVLRQEDLVSAGLTDMKLVMEIEEEIFKMVGEGIVIQPNKIFMPIPKEEMKDSPEMQFTTPATMGSFGMSMPAYLGGDFNVAGFKWAAETEYNITQPDIPYGVDVVVLSDPKTMFPLAFFDGTLTTAMRTSGAAGICAKYMARKNSKVAALIGAGVIGRTMILAMMNAVPGLEEIRLVDKKIEKAEGLRDEFLGKYNIVPIADAKEAMDGADIIVTETTSLKSFIPREWITVPNATVIQMEAYAFENDVFAEADKVLVDRYVQITHLEGHQMHELHEKGLIKPETTIQIADLAMGKHPGRESDDEFIACCTAGMGAVDIGIAFRMYQRCKEMGLGTKCVLWDKSQWV